jgi:protein SCO1/2
VRKVVFGLGLLLVGLLSCVHRARGEPAPEAANSFAPIPNPELTTHEGRTVRFYDDLVRGRVVVIQFFFVHCQGVCPLSTARMLELRDELGERFGREVSFLSITLDPEVDTPDVLATHARELTAGTGWTFLTGARADIDALRRRLGVFDLDPVLDADKNQHAGVLVLGNDRKQRWIMKPAALPARALFRSLQLLAS